MHSQERRWTRETMRSVSVHAVQLHLRRGYFPHFVCSTDRIVVRKSPYKAQKELIQERLSGASCALTCAFCVRFRHPGKSAASYCTCYEKEKSRTCCRRCRGWSCNVDRYRFVETRLVGSPEIRSRSGSAARRRNVALLLRSGTAEAF